jgi:hypothetical protein
MIGMKPNEINSPRPGQLQEIHVDGDQVTNVGIVPLRKFCFEWRIALGDQVDAVDPRLAYLGVVHSGGATLIPLPDVTEHINNEIAAAKAHFETVVSQ